MRTRTLVASLSVLCLVLLAGPASAVNVPSCGGDFVLFAKSVIRIEQGGSLIQGNILVNDPDGFLQVGAHVRIVGTATANKMWLGTGAEIDRCEANVFQNVDPSLVCHVVETPINPPLPCLASWPPIATPPVDTCVDSAPPLTVAAGATESPAAGCYGVVRVNVGGTLNLSGVYNFRQLLLRAGSTLNGPATANVKQTVSTEPGVHINNMQINVPNVGAFEAVQLGNGATITNSVINVPFAKVHLHQGLSLKGSEVIADAMAVEPITTEGGVQGCPCVDQFVVVPNSAPKQVRITGTELNAITEVRLSTGSCEPNAGTAVPILSQNATEILVDVSAIAPGTYKLITISAKGSCCSAATIGL